MNNEEVRVGRTILKKSKGEENKFYFKLYKET